MLLDLSSKPLQGEKIELADGSVAWWPCHLGEGTTLGANCTIGALAHIGAEVTIGKRCKMQGGCYISDRTIIGDEVFIGPNATVLNDRHPPSGDKNLWKLVTIGDGAVIGGGATVIAGVEIGEGAVLAAGATASTDIPAAEVWAGVPATFLMTRDEYERRRRSDDA